MESQNKFSPVAKFFQNRHQMLPGDPDYDAAFCRATMEALSAQASSIWQVARDGSLLLVYGSNVSPDVVGDVALRAGEGISGAVALSRQPIAVADAWCHPGHDRRVDQRIAFRSYSMISAPILFNESLYGVLNLINHTSGGPFPAGSADMAGAVATMYAIALAAAGRLSGFRANRVAGKQKGQKNPAGKTCIVGVSSAMLATLDLCLKAARTMVPVLIRGETGSGKELAARRIHEASSRAAGPFLDVNCASLPETLLESELFGHIKGSFSGANRDRTGKFVEASGGTLFLDEIGDMSQSCQAKILRALQEKKVTPVGSEKFIKCDVRIITATNRNLLADFHDGKFREDLYYRICGIEIILPPLRERREDIKLLAMHFLQKICREQSMPTDSIRLSEACLDTLASYRWPGNVRQLEQAVSAAVALCEGDTIEPEDLPDWLHSALKTAAPADSCGQRDQELAASDYAAEEDCALYRQVLEETKYSGTGRWNLNAAARKLNIPRKTFTYRLKKLQIIS